MKVLIIGSNRDPDGAALHHEFVRGCRELGQALANAKIDVVVGSADANTADLYVLEGVAAASGRHRVWMLRPEGLYDPMPDQISGQIDIVQRRLRGSWS